MIKEFIGTDCQLRLCFEKGSLKLRHGTLERVRK